MLRASALIALLLAFSGCSSGKTSSATRTTKPSASSSSTRPYTTSSSTAGTSPSSTSTTTAVAGSGPVHIDRFTGPSSPVECNAPTMVELHWRTRGAVTVEMHIDNGGAFATYHDGVRDELLPLACDGKAHTYELVAKAGPAVARASLTIATKPPSS